MPDGLSDGDAVFANAEARLGLGGVLASLDAFWVNDPAKVAVAEYKPLQLCAAARSGLIVPRTPVTNDHAAAVPFAADLGGTLVCKTFSSLMLSDEKGLGITFTTPVDAPSIDPEQFAVTAHLPTRVGAQGVRGARDDGGHSPARRRDLRRLRSRAGGLAFGLRRVAL